MTKFLPLGLLSLFLWLPAASTGQTASTGQNERRGAPTSSQEQLGSKPTDDELARRLSAAQSYQLSGDLERAAVENRAVVAISLARLGAIAIRERQYEQATRLLTESLSARDDSHVRTDLAIAHMRLMELDAALAQAQLALTLDQKNARTHHILGKLFYMKGDYTSALPRLERALVLEPDLDAAYTLGMTYLRLKQIERAKLLFEEIQGALNNSANAHLLFGRAYEETGFSDEAEREFKKAIAIDDRAPRAHFYLGYVILQHGGSERLAQAREEFERDLQLDPQSVYTNFFLGVLAATANEHHKAIRHLLETTRLKPNFAEAYLHLGQSQAELGDPNAEKSLRRAIELTTDVSRNSYQIKKAHFVLGRLLLKAGRRSEADKELEIAKELQTKSLESSREEVSGILGQVPKSGEEISAPSQVAAAIPNRADEQKQGSDDVLLIEDAPIDTRETAKFLKLKQDLTEILAQAFHNLGVTGAQKGQLATSLEEFAKAARWKAGLPGLDRNWGIVSFRAEQYDAAIPPLSRHLKIHRNDALIRRMLGLSYYFTRSFPQVVETLSRLEATIKTDPDLSYIYGVSLIQVAEHQRAGQLFESLSEQNPQNAQARFYAGQGFVMLEDYQRALKEFQSAAQLDPKMLQVHYNAGQSLIRLNRLKDAEREFRTELGLNAEDLTAKYHLAYVLLEQKQEIGTALNLLRETIAVRPQYVEARYQLGKALIELGQVSEAIEHLEIAAQAEPSKDYIHYQLSIAYRRASRIADADRSLQLYRALKASNRNRELPGNMGATPNVP
ncbi:MAG TPA: tetratricopeptide repeat protein [Pyrinomonadaceae bacterium]|nr:tetratricopeptide repeat protein [Pyrinomonadaceae bacterium]